MITNTEKRIFDVIEITNEMPFNRVGGVGTVIENLMSGFKKLNLDVLWYISSHQYSAPEQQKILRNYENVVFGNHEELKKFSARVIHIHSYTGTKELVRCVRDCKTVFTIHSLLVYEEKSNDAVLHEAVKWQEELLSSVDCVVLASKAELNYYKQLGYDHFNSRVHIIPKGLSRPHPRLYRRERTGNLGYCGRLVPRKRPEYPQMILREKRFDNFNTLLAGKGFSIYSRNLLNQMNLENRVFYLGWCAGARLDSFYDNIDVLCIPSVYEPFGMVALEAASRKIPVVCSNIDGLKDIMGNHAIYCKPGDYEHFKEAMYRWLDSDQTLEQMVEGAHQRYLKYFTDLNMASNYSKLFNSF